MSILKYLIIILTLVTTSISAQHDGVMSQYMLNSLVINPGYTGSKGYLNVNLNIKEQWGSITGAPSAQIISVDVPYAAARKKKYKLNRVSFGLILAKQSIGVHSDKKVTGSFSYGIKFDKIKTLQFGLAGGVARSSSLYSRAERYDEIDQLIQSDRTTNYRPLFSAGAFYTAKNYYIGYSIPYLLQYSFAPGTDKLRSEVRIDQFDHILTGGYVAPVGKSLKLKPSFLYTNTHAGKNQLDVNCNVIYKNTYMAGISYRNSDAVVGLLEMQVSEKYKISYAYSYSVNRKVFYGVTSHEVGVAYGAPKKKSLRARDF